MHGPSLSNGTDNCKLSGGCQRCPPYKPAWRKHISKNETIFDRPTVNLKNRGSAGPQEQGALDQVPVHRVRELLRGHLQAQRPHDEAQRAAVQVQVHTVETGDYDLSII